MNKSLIWKRAVGMCAASILTLGVFGLEAVYAAAMEEEDDLMA